MPGNKNDENKKNKNGSINPKREDIFSNASREVRLTTQNPLDDDLQDSKTEKRENTKELYHIIDYLDKVKSDDRAKSRVKDPNQMSLFDGGNKRIITPEGDKKTAVFEKQSHYVADEQDLPTIVAEPSRSIESKQKAPDEDGETIIVPETTQAPPVETESVPEEQTAEEPIPVMSVSVGKFSNIVRREYDNYISYDSMEAYSKKSASYSNSPSADGPTEKKPGIKGALAYLTAAFNNRRDNRSKHMDTRQYENEFDGIDEPSKIKSKMYNASTSLYASTLVLVLLTLAGIIFYIIKSANTALFGKSAGAPVIYCAINLLVAVFAAAAARQTIISGIKGIKKLGNRDTSAALACGAVLLQSVMAFFDAGSFYEEKNKFFTPLLLVIMLYMSFAKLSGNERLRKNYSFMNASGKKYVLRNYKDKQTKSLILGSASSPKSNIVFQRPANGFKSFFDISCDGYSGMTLINRAALPVAILGVIVGIINAAHNGFLAFFSSFAAVCCCFVPVNAVLASEMTLSKYSKLALKAKGMISGYAAARRYRSSSCIYATDRALYPKGAPKLVSIKRLNVDGVDEALMSAYAVARAAKSPVCDVFEDMFSDETFLPLCDNVLYEDEKGLIGWVNGERVLVGNADLLKSHAIDTPSRDFEERYTAGGNSISYIAVKDRLCAILIIKYRPDSKVAAALKGLEDVGASLIVSTTNESITPEKIADDFCLYNRSVRVLPSGLGNIFKELSNDIIDDVRPYAVTNGGFLSMAYCFMFSKKITSLVRAVTLLQAIASVLCLAAVAVILISGSAAISPLRLILYTLFWTIVSIILTIITKRNK